MGQIKNIKLHIVTDIKIEQKTWVPRSKQIQNNQLSPRSPSHQVVASRKRRSCQKERPETSSTMPSFLTNQHMRNYTRKSLVTSSLLLQWYLKGGKCVLH